MNTRKRIPIIILLALVGLTILPAFGLVKLVDPVYFFSVDGKEGQYAVVFEFDDENTRIGFLMSERLMRECLAGGKRVEMKPCEFVSELSTDRRTVYKSCNFKGNTPFDKDCMFYGIDKDKQTVVCFIFDEELGQYREILHMVRVDKDYFLKEQSSTPIPGFLYE